jgi:hypothetical protein
MRAILLIQFHYLVYDAELLASWQRMTSRTDNISACSSRAAYMREYRKRKRLEEDNCNNVPKRTKLNPERHRACRETHTNVFVEYMRNYRKRKAQENKTPQEGNSRAAYMREYRKRMRLGEDNCNLTVSLGHVQMHPRKRTNIVTSLHCYARISVC